MRWARFSVSGSRPACRFRTVARLAFVLQAHGQGGLPHSGVRRDKPVLERQRALRPNGQCGAVGKLIELVEPAIALQGGLRFRHEGQGRPPPCHVADLGTGPCCGCSNGESVPSSAQIWARFRLSVAADASEGGLGESCRLDLRSHQRKQRTAARSPRGYRRPIGNPTFRSGPNTAPQHTTRVVAKVEQVLLEDMEVGNVSSLSSSNCVATAGRSQLAWARGRQRRRGPIRGRAFDPWTWDEHNQRLINGPPYEAKQRGTET